MSETSGVDAVEAEETSATEVDGIEPDDARDDTEDLLVLESVDETWELPVWEPTGQVRVDEALEGLTRMDLDDVHGHAAVYADIHQQLRDTLSGLDASS